MNKLRLQDLDVAGKKVLIRVDFNVPLDGTRVTDDTRIRAALPTINSVLDRGGAVILCAHLGRPKGQPDPKYTLAPVAGHLAGVLGRAVQFVPSLTGPDAVAFAEDLAPGEVLLLENTRFDPRETSNDESLAKELAALADVYVNDAFGAAHRAHASTHGVASLMPQAAMGMLMEKEVDYLGKLLGTPDSPFVAVIGGAKVSDKIGVIEQLLTRVDSLMIGGAMSYTFLKAQGHSIGTSLVEDDKLDVATDVMKRAGDRLLLPTDHMVADRFAEDAEAKASGIDIPEGWMGLDIGPKTIARYQEHIGSAKTVIWNGPMGVFEMAAFSKGTNAVADALADATDAGCLSVVGGGDSVAAVTQAGYEDRISHVSTGGGAMLEFLEGKVLPGVDVLTDA
ncbi:MAG: phosphoglycerate kinase [Rhodothermales bacterium]|nr:phosphoglycerate kinase [Rhodothermales bacterium]